MCVEGCRRQGAELQAWRIIRTASKRSPIWLFTNGHSGTRNGYWLWAAQVWDTLPQIESFLISIASFRTPHPPNRMLSCVHRAGMLFTDASRTSGLVAVVLRNRILHSYFYVANSIGANWCPSPTMQKCCPDARLKVGCLANRGNAAVQSISYLRQLPCLADRWINNTISNFLFKNQESRSCSRETEQCLTNSTEICSNVWQRGRQHLGIDWTFDHNRCAPVPQPPVESNLR